MKVAGKSELIRSEQDAPADVCSALRAIAAELEGVQWRSLKDLLSTYPAASTIDDNTVIIPLGQTYCVVIAVNFKAGMVLIEYAGPRASPAKKAAQIVRADR